MRIFNKEKTKEIFEYKKNEGYLTDDKIQIGMSEEVPFIEEKGHYEIIQEYDNGSKLSQWVVDVAGQEFKPSEPIYEDIKVFIPYTEKELIEDQLYTLEDWFEQYDIQTIQYARDMRLDGKSNIDIAKLDAEAVVNAKEIKYLRNQLKELHTK